MFPLNRMILVACMVSLLAACGGGGDSGSSSTPAPATTPVQVAATYGSIYVNDLLGVGYSARYPSQAEANAAAKSQCVLPVSSPTSAVALTCSLKLEFGKDLCGAVYRSVNTATTGAWAVASDGSAVTAEAKALAECIRVGGTKCTFGWSGCNGTGTPSANSQIAFMVPNSSNSSGLPYEEALSEILQSDQPK